VWEQMHARLASLSLDLLFRQEMWGAEDNNNELADAAESVLGMTSWIGDECCTALYANPAVFEEDPRQFKGLFIGSMWVLPPTVRVLRLRHAAKDAVPLVAGSCHLNYGSITTRLSEAQWATTFNDKTRSINRRRVTLPAILGMDANSYPESGVAGDPPLPDPAKIQNKPHIVHRSYIGPDGRRVMETRPDEFLRDAGMQDVARHLAVEKGMRTAVSATVPAYPTHGPQARIDRIYVSELLLPAVVDVEVVDMTGLSDHHTVLTRLDLGILTDLLREHATADAA